MNSYRCDRSDHRLLNQTCRFLKANPPRIDGQVIVGGVTYVAVKMPPDVTRAGAIQSVDELFRSGLRHLKVVLNVPNPEIEGGNEAHVQDMRQVLRHHVGTTSDQNDVSHGGKRQNRLIHVTHEHVGIGMRSQSFFDKVLHHRNNILRQILRDCFSMSVIFESRFDQVFVKDRPRMRNSARASLHALGNESADRDCSSASLPGNCHGKVVPSCLRSSHDVIRLKKRPAFIKHVGIHGRD